MNECIDEWLPGSQVSIDFQSFIQLESILNESQVFAGNQLWVAVCKSILDKWIYCFPKNGIPRFTKSYHFQPKGVQLIALHL